MPNKVGKVKIPSYTAPDFEPENADEWDDIHLEIEQRQFDMFSGDRLSKPVPFIITPAAFVGWNTNRQGYSINKVLHRPAGVEKIGIDPKDPKEPVSEFF